MSEERTRVWTMIADLDFCMLITQSGGALQGRPMSSIVKQEEGKIYFLSEALSGKQHDIAENPAVLLSYDDGSARLVCTAATVGSVRTGR
jgi:general stress protein 26